MRRLIILLFLTTALFSCKTDYIDEVLKTSKKPELDMVFHSIIIENKVNGTSLLVFEKATERKYNGIVEFDTIKPVQNDIIYWNKNIFPKISYLSQDTMDSKLKNEKMFWEFSKENNQGWIKISEPIFTNDKKRVIVFVEFENPDKKFGSTTYYILERIDMIYHIVEKKIISIS